jgi:1,4-dihydroxy-2-naphthoate polyprenyltransferase
MDALLRPWVLAARLKTLPAALVPVGVGTALAARDGVARPALALGCAGFALLVQVGTNFANDYFDWVRGADTAARRGPVRATASGLVSPRAMRRALWVVFAAAALAGLPLAAGRVGELVPLGLLCLLAGWAYTGGPYPLAYHGLGDAFVVVFFGGVAVGGTYYVQAGQLGWGACLCGAGVGLLCDNLLVVNNARDLETDAAAGKRTLVVRFGRRFARAQHAVQLAAAFALPFALGWRTGAWALLASPLALWAGARFRRAQEGAEYNAALGLSAASLLAYGAALAGALAWG